MAVTTVKQKIMDALEIFWNYLSQIVVKYTDIVNNCTSTSTNKPLSAYQGYNLQQQINKLTTFSVQKVTVTIASNANYALINAPTVSGKRFVCWIGCATSGWLGSVFIPDMGAASTSVWKVSGSGNVDCFALYQNVS